MHPPQPFAPPTDPIRRALATLIGAGRALLSRVQAAIAPLPKHLARNPATAEPRIARTLEWVAGLAATLAGDHAWLIPARYPSFPRFPGRYPALTAQLRAECGLPPNPACTPAARAAARRRYMQRVFATVPTATIARRLARRLGLTETAEAWPHDLLAIPQPPAAWAKRPRPTPTIATAQSPPPPQIDTGQAPNATSPVSPRNADPPGLPFPLPVS